MFPTCIKHPSNQLKEIKLRKIKPLKMGVALHLCVSMVCLLEEGMDVLKSI